MTHHLPANPRFIHWEDDNGCTGCSCVDLSFLSLEIDAIERTGRTVLSITRSY